MYKEDPSLVNVGYVYAPYIPISKPKTFEELWKDFVLKETGVDYYNIDRENIISELCLKYKYKMYQDFGNGLEQI